MLKRLADMDAVDVMSSDWSGDINVVASVLKQWLRELPEPLLTHGLYQGFIDAASKSTFAQASGATCLADRLLQR